MSIKKEEYLVREKVLQFINKYDLISKESRLLVGASGGPDSLVLLHFLKQIQKTWHLHIIVAHIDHMLRGKDSYEDYLFVEDICKQWGMTFEGTRVDVAAHREHTGESTELAARKVRYHFFEEMMKKHHCTTLVLGHHGDDQVETILMRLTRGATGKARAGISFKRPFEKGFIVRPFLVLTKDEINEYASFHQLKPRLDLSNEDNEYTRNRFRHEVLPFLKKENPHVHEHFQRFSEEIYEDEAFFQEMVSRRMKEVWIEQTKEFSTINIDSILMMPKSLQRRAIQLILNYLYLDKPSSLSAVHIQQLVALFLHPQPSAELHLPEGLIAKKSYKTCVFRFFKQESCRYSYLLQIPGDTFLPNGYKIKAQYKEKVSFNSGGNDTLIVSATNVTLPLMVRTRRDGDRMRVKGLGGTKKLKELFINEKVPIDKRNEWPVVVDQTGEIIWLPGIRKSYIESENKPETSIIYFEYKKA